jgi:hypothetical protein
MEEAPVEPRFPFQRAYPRRSASASHTLSRGALISMLASCRTVGAGMK